MKVNDIILGPCEFDMRWHEGLQIDIYKGVEVHENCELKCKEFCVYM